MRYKVKQRVFSLGDNFVVKDEYEQDCFIVRGKVFSFGDKLQIEDLHGNILIRIRQEIFRFLPEYYIYSGDKEIAMVKKEFTFFKPRFRIESDLGTYQIEGNFMSLDFNILKDNQIVAQVSKKWFSFGDTYGVDIADDEYQAFILALVIVIDQTLHDNERR